MTNDQIERSINFLLDSQATLTANVEKLTENQSKLTADVEKLTADVEKLTENQSKLTTDVTEMKTMVLLLMQNADADRRLTRELIQDLKDLIYTVDSKADKALKLARKSK